MNVAGLFVFGGYTGIANMRIGQRNQLLTIGGVGQYFLVAGHGGIENHLTIAKPVCSDRATLEQAAVF